MKLMELARKMRCCTPAAHFVLQTMLGMWRTPRVDRNQKHRCQNRHRAATVLGYDVTLAPAHRNKAQLTNLFQSRQDNRTDVHLSSEKSAFAPFGRAGRGKSAARLRSDGPFSAIFARRSSRANSAW